MSSRRILGYEEIVDLDPGTYVTPGNASKYDDVDPMHPSEFGVKETDASEQTTEVGERNVVDNSHTVVGGTGLTGDTHIFRKRTRRPVSEVFRDSNGVEVGRRNGVIVEDERTVFRGEDGTAVGSGNSYGIALAIVAFVLLIAVLVVSSYALVLALDSRAYLNDVAKPRLDAFAEFSADVTRARKGRCVLALDKRDIPVVSAIVPPFQIAWGQIVVDRVTNSLGMTLENVDPTLKVVTLHGPITGALGSSSAAPVYTLYTRPGATSPPVVTGSVSLASPFMTYALFAANPERYYIEATNDVSPGGVARAHFDSGCQFYA